MSGTEFVTLKELAERLRMDRSHARRWVESTGFTFLRVRTSESGNQANLAVTASQAEEIVAKRRAAGFLDDPVVRA